MIQVTRVSRVLLGLALAVQLSFWISLPTGLWDPLFNDSSHRGGKGNDFFQFYQAGANLLRGQSIYRYAENDRVPYGPHNKYPPLLVATLGVASQAFSPWISYGVWVCCIGAFFVVMLFLVRRSVPEGDFLPILTFCLAFTPFYLDLYHGQTNTLMAMLLALMLFGFAVERNRAVGIALSLSANIKMNTLLLAPVLLAKRLWRTLAVSLVVAAVLFLPYFAFFPADLRYFFSYALGGPSRYFFQAGNFGTYPLIQELAYLLTSNTQTIVRTQQAWSVLILIVTAVVHLRSKDADAVSLAALWLSAFFLAYKFIWEHHLVMLLPILAFEYGRNNRRLIALLWLLLALPTPFWFLDSDLGRIYAEIQPYWTQGRSVLYHSVKVVPLAVLYVAIVRRLLGGELKVKVVAPIVVCCCLAVAIAFTFKPYAAKDYCAFGVADQRRGEIAKAQADFETCLSRDPAYIDGYLQYADFLFAAGKDMDGMNVLAKAKTIDPNDEFFRYDNARE